MAEFITETANKTHQAVVQLRKAIRKVDTNKIASFRKTDLTDAYREFNFAMYNQVEETGIHKIYVDFKFDQPAENVQNLVSGINTIEGVSAVWSGSMGSAIIVSIEVK
ncbi:hypothetical protein ZPAH1_orf00026 [Aeromonas phage ZPAH1]|nr:hypothetical protein ZPAH1_orf00026 [Aeromonas phage ZPAH1]